MLWADQDRDGRADTMRLLLQGDALDAAALEQAVLLLPGAVAGDVGALSFRVRVLDDANVFSPWTTVARAAQPIRGEGEACDPARVRDRCAAQLRWGAGTCIAAVAPSAPEVWALEPQPGKRVVVASAADLDGDVTYYELGYLDAALIWPPQVTSAALAG